MLYQKTINFSPAYYHLWPFAPPEEITLVVFCDSVLSFNSQEEDHSSPNLCQNNVILQSSVNAGCTGCWRCPNPIPQGAALQLSQLNTLSTYRIQSASVVCLLICTPLSKVIYKFAKDALLITLLDTTVRLIATET